jgi:hypothetical protein
MRKEASFTSVATAIGLITTALSGGMYVGALANDVETLKKENVEQSEDHDRLIVVETEQRVIQKDVAEVKADVKVILAAIQKIEQKVE